jgi:hypothetical protein
MPWDTPGGGQFKPPAVVNDAELPVCNDNDNQGRNHWGGRGGSGPPHILLGPLQLFGQLFSWGVQSWWGPPSAGNCVALCCDALRCGYGYGLHYVSCCVIMITWLTWSPTAEVLPAKLDGSCQAQPSCCTACASGNDRGH